MLFRSHYVRNECQTLATAGGKTRAAQQRRWATQPLPATRGADWTWPRHLLLSRPPVARSEGSRTGSGAHSRGPWFHPGPRARRKRNKRKEGRKCEQEQKGMWREVGKERQGRRVTSLGLSSGTGWAQLRVISESTCCSLYA